MPEGMIATDRINGWAGIARHLRCDITSAIRWAKEAGLPVHQPSGRRGWVYADRDELDAWSAASYRPKVAAKGERRGRGQEARHSSSNPLPSAIANEVLPQPEGTFPGAPAQPSRSWLLENARWLRWTMAAVALIVTGVFAVHSLVAPRQIRFTGITQLTSDGALKSRMVTNGADLYFDEWREGRIVLSTVSVNGGPVREIPTPFIQTEPVAISADGQRLLVLVGQGQEQERALWIVRVQDGLAQRVGHLLCHSAAWSPDGQRIAFALGNSVYVTSAAGTMQHLLHTFSAVPMDLRWSLDGRRLLFLLKNMTTWDSVVGEMAFTSADHATTVQLVRLDLAPGSYETISPVLNGDDDAFVGTDGSNSTILTFERSRWPWGSKFTLAEVTRELDGVSDFAVDPKEQELYLLKNSPGQSELDWFDKTSREFRPFLPGISARDVDFSRDGRWIAYVRVPNDSLWVAASDGSSARQISTPGMTGIELPRWSPDGKQIAFMGRRVDEPYRIFVTAAAGGPLHEASHGTDNQGAPTWSPNGRRLVYGRVKCQEERICSIQEIDLDTGQQAMVRGSEGLSTARWSPDGRYIAALRADAHQVFLLDRRTGNWRKIADGVNGNDLAWAPDSSAVYASKPGGDRPEVIRISLTGGNTKPAVDLTNFSKLSGRIDTWFAVTPDDSILFLHIVNGQEIYALHYQEM